MSTLSNLERENFWINASILKIKNELKRNKYSNAVIVADTLLWLYPPQKEHIEGELLGIFNDTSEELIRNGDYQRAIKLLNFCEERFGKDTQVQYIRSKTELSKLIKNFWFLRIKDRLITLLRKLDEESKRVVWRVVDIRGAGELIEPRPLSRKLREEPTIKKLRLLSKDLYSEIILDEENRVISVKAPKNVDIELRNVGAKRALKKGKGTIRFDLPGYRE